MHLTPTAENRHVSRFTGFMVGLVPTISHPRAPEPDKSWILGTLGLRRGQASPRMTMLITPPLAFPEAAALPRLSGTYPDLKIARPLIQLWPARPRLAR